MPVNSIHALFKGSDMPIYNARHFLEQFWPDIINKLHSTRQQLNPVTWIFITEPIKTIFATQPRLLYSPYSNVYMISSTQWCHLVNIAQVQWRYWHRQALKTHSIHVILYAKPVPGQSAQTSVTTASIVSDLSCTVPQKTGPLRFSSKTKLKPVIVHNLRCRRLLFNSPLTVSEKYDTRRELPVWYLNQKQQDYC